MTHVALDRSQSDASSLAAWGFALALATLGTAILWKASIGINWGVWTACVVAALFAIIRDRFGFAGVPSLVAGSWAVLLAFGTAVTSDGFRVALLVLATTVLVAIALVVAGDRSLDVLRPVVALQAPLVALALVFSGIGAEASGSVRTARSPAVASLVRTMLITVPVVFVLILLLAEADPIFAAARDGLEHAVPEDFIGRSFFFSLLLGVTLGAYASAQRGQLPAHGAVRPKGLELGSPERRVLLSALASIMWLFVASATISLLKNPAAIAGSGITYAEYVHRGFAELTVAATLVIGAVLVTRKSWIATDAWARPIAAMALVGESGMIVIAFMRIVRYEQAYGFTTQRLYAQAYMIALACMSGLLLQEIARRRQSGRFAYHSVTASLVILASCVYFNIDAWIVRQNVDRYVRTGALDVRYLTDELSEDATPALAESVSRLREPERGMVVESLRKRGAPSRHARHDSWYSWNYRASRSVQVGREFQGNNIF